MKVRREVSSGKKKCFGRFSFESSAFVLGSVFSLENLIAFTVCFLRWLKTHHEDPEVMVQLMMAITALLFAVGTFWCLAVRMVRFFRFVSFLADIVHLFPAKTQDAFIHVRVNKNIGLHCNFWRDFGHLLINIYA